MTQYWLMKSEPEECSIDDDAQLRAEWAEQSPVTLVDGRQHDFWRVDPERLRGALAH